MTSTSARPGLLVLGAGEGLGMSVAHRFGAEVVRWHWSRAPPIAMPNALRFPSDAGVEAAAFTGDAMDSHSLRHAVGQARNRFGRIDVGYYPPAAFGPLTPTSPHSTPWAPQTHCTASWRLPEMTDRGVGGRTHLARRADGRPTGFGGVTAGTLDPDELVETVRQVYLDGTEPEAVINALAA